ncbi:formyltetrahydrofolate deformylase [Terribacillus aidingensis]|jgi:formyltetrahydrofolate deformylase|uniref:Formyltetrahydrofolate deformylase n=1 Tax=Terribacillus aidingensis TaxID=586416 RepID=A0A285N8M6_9BACI|nr:formyltetrahydrofolate deformylase [Terribacillus aidingensis]SNZ04071.1 formyltetrahydrofolate deformylase [Terribacillus aidingensis]
MAVHFLEKIKAFQQQNENRYRIVISCPDQPGIVAAVSEFLYKQKANIMESNQYTTDPDGGSFFLRIEFECQRESDTHQLEEDFQSIAAHFQMDWQLVRVRDLKKLAVFVSKELHCLQEILWEYQSGNLMADLAVIVSNHEDARDLAEAYGIPFHHIPANKDIRQEAERQQLSVLKQYQIDTVILARYMQILTPAFLENYKNKIINIHHSFLPAFIGAKPYERAFERGVKLIGATSHYVTSDLDEGPIIEQDIHRVNHKDKAADLKRVGRLVERSVLMRAMKWHVDDRVIVFGNKTIIF